MNKVQSIILKVGNLVRDSFKELGYSYILGPYMAKYMMVRRKYSFLSKHDALYHVVVSRKPIAKFQAKHGPLGVLSDTNQNLLVRELVEDRETKDCFSVERCISHVNKEAIFIPICKGRVVAYWMYRYALHDYFYEFLRSGESIEDTTEKGLYSAFSRCSGLEISSINSLVYLGSICPDSISSHVRIGIYAVELKDFDFNSLEAGMRSVDFAPHFNRRFSKVMFLTLSDVSEYIQKERIIDGVTMSAFSLMVSSLMQKSPELYQELMAENQVDKLQAKTDKSKETARSTD